MPHLLNVWPSVSQLLRDAHRVLLLLDYDGTLAPIVPRPDLAELPTETRESLLELRHREKYIVGIVTARSLADISARVGIEELIYAGNHGLEIRGPDLYFMHPQATQIADTASQVYESLQQVLAGLAGVLIEHKGFTLTVHYRQTPQELVPKVKESVASILGPFLESGLLTISPSKKAMEIRPDVSWDKGTAIYNLQKGFTQASVTVYFGDDFSDEAGFATVQDSGGLAVFVGPSREPTVALYRVDSPNEVAEVLRLMANL